MQDLRRLIHLPQCAAQLFEPVAVIGIERGDRVDDAAGGIPGQDIRCGTLELRDNILVGEWFLLGTAVIPCVYRNHATVLELRSDTCGIARVGVYFRIKMRVNFSRISPP